MKNELRFDTLIQPLPTRSQLKLDGWLVWGGSMVRSDDGTCHLFFSRWPKETKHQGWVTHSEIAYATAAEPLGPYQFQMTALKKRSQDYWDGDVTHNPTVLQWKNKYYLYYTGNKGNSEYWEHRNNQRIGVAVAENPQGPWQRFDQPLLDVSATSWDALITTNPSCTPTPDGRFMLMYKAAGKTGKAPMFGPVLHGVAFANQPDGPFIKHPQPIFTSDDARFPGEDPFVWYQDDRYYALLKDMGQFYSEYQRALVLFESFDGIQWELTPNPVALTRDVQLEDGSRQLFHRLERPQLYIENGKPKVLFCAVLPDAHTDDSYNIHIPLKYW